MKISRSLAACALGICALFSTVPPAHAGFSTLWIVGVEDGTPNEFDGESGSSNSLPGSALIKDDDYYLAGTYAAPIGFRATSETLSNFERAVTSGDPNNRIHFNLTASQASATSRFRITFRMLWAGSGSVSGFGSHNLVVKMNGQTLATRTFTQDYVMTVLASSAQGAAVTGANRIEISRTGGSPNAWIQFDYVTLEVDPTALTDTDGDGLPQWWELDSGLSDTNGADAAADSDADGSTNTQEFARGTNPRLADTDGDGLKDGVETNTGTYVSPTNTGTNPLVADTDGDSLLDGAEVALVPPANPLLVDTDGDGAPDAWEVRTGYLHASTNSIPPAFPHALGLKFVCDLAPGDALSTREVTGLVPQMNWNSTRPLATYGSPTGATTDVATPTPGVLVNSAGVASGVTATWSSDNLNLSGNGGGPNQKLLNSYLSIYGTAPVDLTLSGIPAAAFPTYDVLVYVGSSYSGPRGYVRLNDQTSSDRYFRAGSARPETQFLEPIGSTAARPWQGNVIRFRNVTGPTCNVKVFRVGDDYVGLHAIQIVHSTADADADGLPDWWEFTHKLRPNFAGDAALDTDGDGLTNTVEFARKTNPTLTDTDSDGLTDNVETGTGTWASATNTGSNPLLADTDADGLNDGREVNALPAATNPNLADTDGDGRSDAEELASGTDPVNTTASNASMPVITTSPRSFVWEITNLQLVWDHGRGHAANSTWSEDYLFTASINNLGTGYGNALKVGVRFKDGRLTHFFYSNRESAFSYSGQPDWDIWESDWDTPPVDKRAAMGFSGHGRVDISDRLRFRVSGSSTGAQNAWAMTFELRNLDTNQVVATTSYTNCTLAANVYDNTAIWENDAGAQNRLNFWEHAGVEAYLQTTPLENTPAFAAYKDTDEDGMPDVWEDARSFNKNSAADAALDADTDGATNLREYLAGTDPRIADTDGDNVRDGAELNAGSDPLLATSRPAYSNGLPAGVSGEDLNGNGLPDAWEQWVGNFSLTPNSDSDGDGYSNANEALAGTNALDANSHLWSSAVKSGNNLVLRWPRLTNKRHEVTQSPNLLTWTTAAGAPVAVGNEFQQNFTLAGPNRFFRPGVGNLDTDLDGVSDWTEANVLGSSSTAAHSLRSAAPMDTNNDGSPDTTISGDYAALLERMQGASVSGGFPGGGGGSTVSRVQASRFLSQATFGPTPADLDRVQQLGFAAWITEQLAKPATLHSTYIRGIYADFAGQRADLTYNYSAMDQFLLGNNLTTAFARAAVQGEDQLRQRVAYALSQILVTSLRDANLENQALGMADYYDIFVRHAFGNYRDILTEVTLHPCMGRYLSSVGNQKADPTINRFPDENYGREVMQLFTIGLWQLNPDGTRKVNGSGQNIPSYNNVDITQVARVFTGLWYGGKNWGDGGYSPQDYATPMTMNADRHDFGEKILPGGAVIPQRAPSQENGVRDIADTLRHLFDHANTGPFIGRQLIQFLVTDNPSPAYVQRVGNAFADNGSGVRGDLGAVTRAILLDEEARDPRYPANNPGFGKLREPVLRAMMLGRAFGMKNVPTLLWWDWGDFFADARQMPMNSPSVFNFYRPDYRAPGLLTQNNLAAPVFQITDSYSAIAFPNKLWSMIEEGFSLYDTYRFPLDLSSVIPLAATPELLIDHLNTLFCAGQMSAATRTILLNAVNTIPAAEPEARVRVAAYLVSVAPEGAVLK